MVGLSRQEAWAWWENFVKRKISWSDIWHADASRLKFLVQSIYDVLPSPANLCTWGNEPNTTVSTVCRKKAHEDKLWVPVQGQSVMGATVGDTTRYLGRWSIQWTLQSARTVTSRRGGWFTPSKPACKINSCLLSIAQDWQWRVDIGERLKVPEQIATITLRPDLFLWSTETRQVLLIELTVPWEENINVACERKLEKY